MEHLRGHLPGYACEVKLNGERVSTSDELKNLKGFIGLQGEGGELEFRAISLKKLELKK